MTIVVTGLGAVTALGRTARETWARVVAGERGLGQLTLFDPGEVKTRLVAEVAGLEVPAHPSVSRTSELALIAAREAIVDAGLDVRTRRVGLVVGGSTAGMLETESLLATLLSNEHGSERDAALARMLSHPLSAPTDRLVQELGPFARARSISSACSSGANALVIGALWLELGLVDAVVCGAADALCRVIVAGFSALGALDPEGARPFDVHRRGLTLGEGAGFIVLERGEGTVKERVKCTLLGWGSSSEAHHITNPEPSGAVPAKAMRAALARAGLEPGDIDWINAHGTGTTLNDPMEARAIGSVFGHALTSLRVSSQKGMIGHTLAASGAIEAVLTVLALQDQVVPPTGGLSEPDPACPLRHVRTAERTRIRAALSNAFGFGGMDTALVFGAGDRPPAFRLENDVMITGIAALTPAGTFTGLEVGDLPGRPTDAVEVTIPELDPDRARRLDRSSKIVAALCERVLEPGADRSKIGIVMGIAFGAVDATAEFMGRLRDKGARLVRPADFPSLVPSSPAGHVSIYGKLGGPSLVVADLAASGECAVAQGWEMVRSGEVERICVAAVEERSAIVEEVLSVVFGGTRAAPRREGGVAIALGGERLGLPALARLERVISWSGAGDLDALPPPPDGAVVVLGGAQPEAAAIVARSRWSQCRQITCGAAGTHEAVGGIAVAVAAAVVARREAPLALFVGSARGSGYAGIVSPP